MLGEIKSEEDFASVAGAIDELLDAEPGTEGAEKLHILVHLVRDYAARASRLPSDAPAPEIKEPDQWL